METQEVAANQNDYSVGNFQIQYFPNSMKDRLDAVSNRNKISRRELFILIAEHAEEIEDFMKKKKILVARH